VRCTEILPEFDCQGQMVKQGHRGQKNEKKPAESSPYTMRSRVCVVCRTQQAATDDSIAWPPRGDGLGLWENQRILSSFIVFPSDLVFAEYTSEL